MMMFTLIARLVTGEAGIFLTRLRRQMGLFALVVVFATAVLIFLVTALFIWSAQRYGGVQTVLIFAGVFFIFTIIAYLLTRVGVKTSTDRDEDRLQRDIASIAGVTALTNAPQIIRALGSKRGLVAVPVAVAGFYGLYKLVAAMRGR